MSIKGFYIFYDSGCIMEEVTEDLMLGGRGDL